MQPWGRFITTGFSNPALGCRFSFERKNKISKLGLWGSNSRDSGVSSTIIIVCNRFCSSTSVLPVRAYSCHRDGDDVRCCSSRQFFAMMIPSKQLHQSYA